MRTTHRSRPGLRVLRIPKSRTNVTMGLMVNLIATALWVLLGIGVNWFLGLSEQFSLITVAVFVFVGGSLFVFVLSTNALRTISSPYTVILLLFLAVSILTNVYLIVIKPNIKGTTTIQSLQPSVSTWGADYDGDNDTGGSNSFNVKYLSDSNTEYAIRYTLPEDKKDVWAGVSFVFPEKQDFTQYKTLRLRIVFGDPTEGGDNDANCLLEIISPKKKVEFDLRKATGQGTSNERTVTIDLAKDIQGVDLKSVEQLSFKDDGRYPLGTHSYSISDIELTR